jgi:hypothetical protein
MIRQSPEYRQDSLLRCISQERYPIADHGSHHVTLRRLQIAVLLLILLIAATATAAPLWTHESTQRVTGVAVSKDAGTVVLTADSLRFLGKNGTERGMTWAASAVAVSRDGAPVATAGTEGVRLFDRNGSEVWSRGPGPATAVAVSQDGKFVAAGTGQNTLQVFDGTGKLVGSAVLSKKEKGAVLAVAIDTTGATVAAVDSAAVGVYARSGKLLKRTELDNPATVAIAANGTVVAVGRVGGVALLHGNGTLKADVRTGTNVLAVAVNRSGDLVAAGSEDGTLSAFDGSGNRLWNVTGPGRIAGIGVSEDGAVVSAAWYGGTIRFLDSAGTLLREETATGIPTAFAFSPDGGYGAVGSDDGTTALLASGVTPRPTPTPTPKKGAANATPAVNGSVSNSTKVSNGTAGNLTKGLNSSVSNQTAMNGTKAANGTATAVGNWTTTKASTKSPANTTAATLTAVTLETFAKPADVPAVLPVLAVGALALFLRRYRS